MPEDERAVKGKVVTAAQTHAPEHHPVDEHRHDRDAVGAQHEVAHGLRRVGDVVDHAENEQRGGQARDGRLLGVKAQQHVAAKVHEGHGTGGDRQGRFQPLDRNEPGVMGRTGPEALAHHHAHGDGDGKRNLIERGGDVAHDLVRRHLGRAQARNEYGHERKGAHLKKDRQADGHAELELRGQSLEPGQIKALGAHLVVKAVLLIHEDVAGKRKPGVDRQRQSRARAAQGRKAQPAVHEDAV